MKIIERLYKIIPATFPRFHISIERWKYNKEFEVWVSNYGNILNKEKNPIRVKTSNKRYMVCQAGKRLIMVHRLVLMTWNPRKDADKLTVDHINSNPRDNRLVNLEWVTEEENKTRAKENHIVLSPITDEKSEILQEQKKNSGMSKEQATDYILSTLTARFFEGKVWLSHKGQIINKDNFYDFAMNKNGLPAYMPKDLIARRFINAGYRSGKYCGWHWTLCGEKDVKL